MEYLVVKLFWWLLAAFAVGLLIGWMSCSRTEADRT
jgi:hypothetical protein